MYHKREVKVSSHFWKANLYISVSVVRYYTLYGNKGVFSLVGK